MAHEKSPLKFFKSCKKLLKKEFSDENWIAFEKAIENKVSVLIDDSISDERHSFKKRITQSFKKGANEFKLRRYKNKSALLINNLSPLEKIKASLMEKLKAFLRKSDALGAINFLYEQRRDCKDTNISKLIDVIEFTLFSYWYMSKPEVSPRIALAKKFRRENNFEFAEKVLVSEAPSETKFIEQYKCVKYFWRNTLDVNASRKKLAFLREERSKVDANPMSDFPEKARASLKVLKREMEEEGSSRHVIYSPF